MGIQLVEALARPEVHWSGSLIGSETGIGAGAGARALEVELGVELELD